MLRALTIVMLGTALALTAASAEAASLRVTKDSSIELRGKTNVAPWRCTSRSVRGTLDIGASPAVLETLLSSTAVLPAGTRIESLPAGVTIGSPSFAAAMPVRSFDCGNPIMERDMRRALKESTAPEIRFDYRSLSSATVRKPSAPATAAWEVGAEVELKLAGRTQRVPMVLRAERLSQTRFRVTGSIRLRMTDFDITPPVGMMGMIRAEDELTVNVNLQLEAV